MTPSPVSVNSSPGWRLADDCTMFNRASMAKFGIGPGQVTRTFRTRACAR